MFSVHPLLIFLRCSYLNGIYSRPSLLKERGKNSVFVNNQKVNIEFLDSIRIMEGEMRMFCVPPHSLAVSLD